MPETALLKAVLLSPAHSIAWLQNCQFFAMNNFAQLLWGECSPAVVCRYTCSKVEASQGLWMSAECGQAVQTIQKIHMPQEQRNDSAHVNP